MGLRVDQREQVEKKLDPGRAVGQSGRGAGSEWIYNNHPFTKG